MVRQALGSNRFTAPFTSRHQQIITSSGRKSRLRQDCCGVGDGPRSGRAVRQQVDPRYGPLPYVAGSEIVWSPCRDDRVGGLFLARFQLRRAAISSAEIACSIQQSRKMRRSVALITTVLPTFRRPQLLARAIRSVLDQTVTDFEVHVYDNASGDETSQIVLDIVDRDRRVKYYRHPTNIGAIENFKFGVARVAAPYFNVLSDDDFLLPGFLNVRWRH
jgi:hypothetical protein